MLVGVAVVGVVSTQLASQAPNVLYEAPLDGLIGLPHPPLREYNELD